MKRSFIFLAFASLPIVVFSQTDSIVELPKPEKQADKWYDKVSIRGYVQLRYNRLLETNPDLGCEQCDRSWGDNGGFFIRRTRIIFFGQLSKQVYFYIQPDFASSVSSSSLHYSQLRDAYFDIGLDAKNEFRFRVGQSKVPFGFENLQSSQNRLPLDRNDALNSPLSNERDLGIFFYWAPDHIRKRFSMLVRDGYKGSGDYGVLGIGAYNGQTANKPEQNNEPHVVARLTYPFEIGSQIIEPSLQAYAGNYVITPDQLSKGVKYKEDRNYFDQRTAATLVLYPRPIGFQAEFNTGVGPEFNKQTDSIETRALDGGYITLNAFIKAGKHIIYPFTRAQYYSGGIKQEKDSRSYRVNEYEAGIEWQPGKNFELVVMYTYSIRRYEDFIKQDNKQEGYLLRLQAQINF